MPQPIILKANGLRLTGNTLAEDGSGSLEKADNVMCRAGGVAEVRRGQALDTNTFGSDTGQRAWAFYYHPRTASNTSTHLLAWVGNSPFDGDVTALVFYRNTSASGAWTQIPCFATGVVYSPGYSTDYDNRSRVRFVGANKNTYLNHATPALGSGLMKYEAIGGCINPAGMYQGVQVDASIAAQAAGFVPGNCQYAYRYLFGRRDVNNNVILGAPSNRTVIASTKVSTAAAGMVRVANVVTVTVASHSFVTSDVVAMDAGESSAGETSFPSGNKTITGTTATTFTYAEVAAAATSTSAHHFSRTFDVKLNMRLPYTYPYVTAGLPGEYFVQVYRSRASANDATVPDDELALVYETPVSAKFGTLTTLSRTGTTVTATTSQAHGFTTGDRINFDHTVGGFTAGLYQIASTPTTSTFTFTQGSGTASATTSQPVWYVGPTTSTFQRNAGTTVTVTTVAAHGFTVGQYIRWQTTVGDFVAGTYSVATTPSGTTFTVTQGSGAAGPTSSTQTVFPDSIIFTDNVPDALRQATLYTAPSEEGPLQMNLQPPFCRDYANFNGYTFAASPIGRCYLRLTLMGVGTTGNTLRSGDTLIIAGVTFTGASAEDFPSAAFKVYTTGSASQNVADTIASIARCINYSVNSLVNAFVLSGPDDPPGILYLEERYMSGTTGLNYSVYTSTTHGNAWQPNLPTVGGIVRFNDDRKRNAIRYSKPNQPEAWPIDNEIVVGSADKETLRLEAARDSLYVWREDGLFRIIGDTPPFTAIQVDSAAVIMHPETSRAVNDKVYGLTTKGVVEATDSGVRVISGTDLGDLPRTVRLTGGNWYTHACVYNSEHLYMLYVSNYESQLDTTSTFTGYYIFDYESRLWSRWPITRSCALATFDQSQNQEWLRLGDSASHAIYDERKSNLPSDYADTTVAVTISSHSTDNLSVTLSSATGVAAGDVLFQGTQYAVITAVVGNVLTIHYASANWSNAAATVYNKIAVDLIWNVTGGGSPGTNKLLSEALIIFRDTSFTTAKAQFWSDMDRTLTTVDVTGPQANTTISATAESSSTAWATSAPVPQAEASGRVFKVGINTLNAYSWSRIEGVALQITGGSGRGSK